MLPSRKDVRLPGYDYAQSGFYFVTVCSENKKHIFGNIINFVGVGRDRPAPNTLPQMKLNRAGIIIEEVWKSLPDHHSVRLDEFQVMPNHIHGIIQIIHPMARNTSRDILGASRRAPTKLGVIVGLFKSECTKQIRIATGLPTMTIWQRNYYEHIIRNEKDYLRIKKYIRENPMIWEKDEDYTMP